MVNNFVIFRYKDYSECQSSPCLNGGICQENSFDDFTCICPTGLLGKRCDISTYCFKIKILF